MRQITKYICGIVYCFLSSNQHKICSKFSQSFYCNSSTVQDVYIHKSSVKLFQIALHIYHKMSQARLPSCIPLPLEHKVLVNVIEKAKDWALMHGVGMRDKKHFTKDAIQIAPFALLPSPFPRTEFNKAVELQPILNQLMHKVAHDDEFLEHTLQNALQVDEFTASLYDIWMKVRKEGITQPISLGMLRSDIMLESRCPHTENQCAKHTPYCSWKQVEINSIASGFGHLGPVSREIQR